MGLNYENLDEITRSFMLSEVDLDLSNESPEKPYISKRFNELGKQNYVPLLKEAIEHHNDDWLAEQLCNRGYMKEHEQGRRVPKTASETLSEGQFNHYYMRGLCARVIKEGIDQVEVYRGKPVSQPRPESKAILEKKLSAKALLEDLRESFGTLLGGPNSGITVHMVK